MRNSFNPRDCKKVIICGCNLEDRRRVENFLGPGYWVIGVMDVDREVDPLEDEPEFYSPDRLKNLDFDYIVLSSMADAVVERWKKSLLDKDVPEEKIVNPLVLRANSSAKMRENMVQTVREADDDSVYGLMFGLSYARKGIDRSKLRGKWFDFSSDGMDLYYNLQLLKYAFKQGKFPHAKEALLVAPNYYFQYDQSRSYAQYTSGQMFAVHELDDYHNFQKVGGEYYPEVRNYIINYRMFGKRISEYYHPHRFTNPTTVWDGQDGEGKLPGGWLKSHENTMPEYLDIFREFINLLSQHFIRLTILHPPLYLKGMVEEHRQIVLVRNKEFLSQISEIVTKAGCRAYWNDFTSVFAERRELFRDLEHLNTQGAAAWGEIINEKILNR